ncbi:MAG: hypothetical protein ABI185_10105 [Ginsengibacter sp.]
MKTLNHTSIILAFLLLTLAVSAQHSPFGKFKGASLGTASCRTTDSNLIINSGVTERIYRLTPWGLRTTGLSMGDSKERIFIDSTNGADWDMGSDNKAILNFITARIDNDSGFTSKHITVVNEFEYREIGLKLRYVIWIYPGSGIRTQIELKIIKDGKANAYFNKLKVEYLPIQLSDSKVTAFGYYNNTERRDEAATPILKEQQVYSNTFVDWASGLLIQRRTNGLILIKESHKCVNQPGIVTGGFKISPYGVSITGLGLNINDLDANHFIKCWASWIIPYKGDSTYGMLALKKFDRMRYPLKKNDIYIMANTWGSGSGRYASREENVLKEIASQASLGIDVQQIDDGWENKYWRPRGTNSFYTATDSLHPVKYDAYPDGWNKVKQYATQKGIILGLWGLWTIPEKDLIWNYNQVGFKYYKLDGSYIDTKERLDNFRNRVRSFILYTHHSVRVNLDVTENSPRFGYFYGKEYGNIFLENREPFSGSYAFITYTPYLVLRDAWQIAKFINLNKFQIPIQDADKVNRLESDAYLYPNPYCVAIALMGSPVFFEETHFYSCEARKRIKYVLQQYKQYRNEMFKGYVSPIGHVPDNTSWTGFQNFINPSGSGFLLIFRELHNENTSENIKLKFIRNKSVELTNLLTGRKIKLFVNKEGLAKFTINKPADFRFYKYDIMPG